MLGMRLPNRSRCTGHVSSHTQAGCVLELLRGSSGRHPRCTLQHQSSAALVLALLIPVAAAGPVGHTHTPQLVRGQPCRA